MITFREFLIICEKKSSTPPHAVPGTFVQHPDGGHSYTLARHDAPPAPLVSAKKVTRKLEDQGGNGGKAIEKMLKKRAKKIKKIKEDIETRRQELHQRQLNQMKRHRQSVADYQATQKEKKETESEREKLKKEIHQELGAEARAQ